MAKGENSGANEIKYKYSRRSKSGTVIRELDINTDPSPNSEQYWKRDPDQYMPITNVIRIMRRILPAHAKIADDAKETMQECVSEFISFVTSEANAKCNQDFRNTVTPEDVLQAMGALGFDNYAEALTLYLNKHRSLDPDRGSVQPLHFVRRDPPIFVQDPTPPPLPLPLPPPLLPPQPPQSLPPPPDMVFGPYVPLPPTSYGDTNYLMFNDYFRGYIPRGGDGFSKDMEEFDPFK